MKTHRNYYTIYILVHVPYLSMKYIIYKKKPEHIVTRLIVLIGYVNYMCYLYIYLYCSSIVA